MVLVAQCHDVGDGGLGDVHDGQGVVLLQGHPGGLAIGRYGNVFGLQILCHRGAALAVCCGAKQAHSLGHQLSGAAVEGFEVGGAHHGRAGVAHIHHADGTFGVNLVVVAGLGFVGDQDGLAIGREGQHVGQCTYWGRAQQLQVGGLVDGDAASIGLGLGLNGDGHQPVLYGHAVDFAVGQYGCAVDFPDFLGVLGVAQIQHIQLA